MAQYTPTQQRILDLLSDGLPHRRAELRACLSDELSGPSNLRSHLTRLRNRLRPRGEDIICELRQGLNYRHIRLLVSPYDGVR